jgi:class 3 adenylate cyclase
MDGCLAGGVPSTDHEHVLALHRPGLGSRRAVEDACPVQRLEAGHAQAPPRHAGGDDHRARRDLGSAGQPQQPFGPACPKSRGGLGEDEVRPEQPGLLEGPVGEVVTADPAGKAEVVPDPGAGSGLAAEHLRLDHQRVQALDSEAPPKRLGERLQLRPLSVDQEDDRCRHDVRKVVTVIFCDVTGSTALGERLDTESLSRVMASYFDAMRAVIDRHHGVVQKFVGDAVVAVFGVPIVREDDALWAVRAAAAMQEALGILNDDLARDWGVDLRIRIGVSTGEVMVGDPRLVTRW